MARFTDLPEELVSNIAARLGSDDLFGLRLSCRILKGHSFHEFAMEYFTSKTIMLTTHSLQALVNIASHDLLKNYVHSVFIMTCLFSRSTLENFCGCHRLATRHSEAYRFYCQDQETLWKDKLDRALLAKALSLLPGVTTVGLIDGASQFDPPGKCYGMNKVVRQTSTVPMVAVNPERKDMAYIRHVSYVWRLLLDAMATSHIATIRTLETRFGHSHNGLFIQDLYNKPNTSTLPILALNGLTRLSLCVRGSRVTISDKDNSIANWSSSVSRLAGHLTGLQELELVSDMGELSAKLVKPILRKVPLENLTKLRLDSFDIEADTLVKTLKRAKSLRELQLEHNNIENGSWVPVLMAIQKLKNLDHLHLMCCMEEDYKVYFSTQPPREDEWEDEPGQENADSDMFSNLSFQDVTDDEEEDMPHLQVQQGAPVGEPERLEGNLSDFEELSALANSAANADTPPTGSPTYMPLHTGAVPSAATEQTANTPYGDHNKIYDGEEVGFYFCLRGKEIKERLPRFIEEYNIGDESVYEELASMFPMMGGALPPGAVGFPPPLAGPPPPTMAALLGTPPAGIAGANVAPQGQPAPLGPDYGPLGMNPLFASPFQAAFAGMVPPPGYGGPDEEGHHLGHHHGHDHGGHGHGHGHNDHQY